VTAVSGVSGPGLSISAIEALRGRAGEAAPCHLALRLAAALWRAQGELARVSEEPPQRPAPERNESGPTDTSGARRADGRRGLEQLIRRAVTAAAARSRELAS